MDGLIIPQMNDFAALADADAQRVRATALDKLAVDPARYLSEYSERFDNVLNADHAGTAATSIGVSCFAGRAVTGSGSR